MTNDGFSTVVTLPNGVDLATLPPRESGELHRTLRARLGLTEGTRYVACIARFHPVKDHATLVRAWRRVTEQVKDAKLLLVGDGPERPTIEAKCRELGVQESVEFWGIRHDVADILRAVDVFALTSLSEASSLTLLEAMASECPSVVTNVGGNAEHLTHGEHGFLAPRGDVESIAQFLCKLLNDDRLSQKMGQAARSRVIKNFALSAAVQSYAKFFKQLASM